MEKCTLNCLKTSFRRFEKNNEEKILEDETVKYFSLINFTKEEIYFESIEFKSKSFVECYFSEDFLSKNEFSNCRFINCEFNCTEETLLRKLINENEIRGGIGIAEKISNDNILSLKMNNSQPKIIDTREGIEVDSYVIGQKYFTFDINKSDTDSEIKKQAIQKIEYWLK
ncbi:hypothetical protein, partial [Streptococcus phocae]|uniref:hypothetical protein n=1 Tax=Streptococcus phocae TaxID=119224 RepID=UPI00190FBB0D